MNFKLLTAGVALVAATAIGSAATATYLTHAPRSSNAPSTVPDGVLMDRPGLAPIAPATRVGPALHRGQSVTAPPPAVVTRRAVMRSQPARAAVQTVAAPVVTDCDTTGDRVWRIAKPGLVGTLLGAGMGAAGGAIADGGKAAGKGAVIGGLAGAAVGSAYGAYKTKQECGSVLGVTAGGAGPSGGGIPLERAITQTALGAGTGPGRIAVYSAR